MKIQISAIGRMKKGPAKSLCDDYLGRVEVQGRTVGVRTVTVRDFPESSRPDKADRLREEASALTATIPVGGVTVGLDETGKTFTSQAFSQRLGTWLDQGEKDLTFLIGGPDGHGIEIRDRCDFLLSFGPMTWPHMFARAMLTEQLYRAVTILTKHPYHRE